MITEYFLVSAKSVRGPASSAFAPEGTKLAHDLESDIKDLTELPFDLDIVKLTVGSKGIVKSGDLTGIKDIWLDYQPNSLAWPLFSEKLKKVIEDHLTGNEGLTWVSAKINANGEKRNYFIPLFGKSLDVLDMQNTSFIPGTDDVMMPVFSLPKIQNFSVFPMADKNQQSLITSEIFINKHIKNAILKAKLIAELEKASVA